MGAATSEFNSELKPLGPLEKRVRPDPDSGRAEEGGGGLADLAQRITPVSPSMASREAALASLTGRLRPLTAALRREARCAGNPARFHASKEFEHEHPRHIARS
jgi:hypothetical protein